MRVWFDEWEILPGDPIFNKIEIALEQSQRLLLCLSPQALASDWATLEMQTVRFRDPLNRERRFIPLRLSDCEAKGTLAQFKYLDWHRANEPERQLLVALCKGAAPPAPAPTTIPAMAASPPSDWQTLVQNWPGPPDRLRLHFINPLGQPITRARSGDDCLVRLDVAATPPAGQAGPAGQLALFSRGSDGAILQWLPHRTSHSAPLASGHYVIPGPLFDQSALRQAHPTGARLLFGAAGQEQLLALLAPRLPAPLVPVTALCPIDASLLAQALATVRHDPHAALAHASLTVS